MSGGWGTPGWMGGEPGIGETFVWGRTKETARDLLSAAEELGLDVTVVRTTRDGFVVPDAVWDKVQEKHAGDQGGF